MSLVWESVPCARRRKTPITTNPGVYTPQPPARRRLMNLEEERVTK